MQIFKAHWWGQRSSFYSLQNQKIFRAARLQAYKLQDPYEKERDIPVAAISGRRREGPVGRERTDIVDDLSVTGPDELDRLPCADSCSPWVSCWPKPVPPQIKRHYSTKQVIQIEILRD